MAVNSKAVMPAMVEIAERGRDEISVKLNKIRAYVLAGLIPPVVLMAVCGEPIIALFYDPRYLGAGWILQVLSVGVVAQLVASTMSPIFIAQGDSFLHMVTVVSRAVVLLISMVVGYSLQGQVGLVCGIAAAAIVWLPIVSLLTRKYVDIDHRATLLAIGSSALVVGVGWYWVGLNIR
jgi:O-antigen/teichoic acid export membrane protein